MREMLSRLEAGVGWSGKLCWSKWFQRWDQDQAQKWGEGCRNRVIAFRTEGTTCADPEAREGNPENIRVHTGWRTEGWGLERWVPDPLGLDRSLSKARSLFLRQWEQWQHVKLGCVKRSLWMPFGEWFWMWITFHTQTHGKIHSPPSTFIHKDDLRTLSYS